MALSTCAKAHKLDYERHTPEKSLLYKTIQQTWPSFVARCEAENHPVPSFVKREFEAYLRCGISDTALPESIARSAATID